MIAYRVCLERGCFPSDSVAAVNQAIPERWTSSISRSRGRERVRGRRRAAFLDAFQAGILVNASAGNSGPGAATADDAGAWTTTVGASTPPDSGPSTGVVELDTWTGGDDDTPGIATPCRRPAG